MSKVKKTLGLVGIGIASLALSSGAGLVAVQMQSTSPTIELKADTKETITNTVPEFFSAKTSDGKDLVDSPLLFSSTGKYISLKFDTVESDDETYYTYNKNGNSWQAFSFTDFSITRNGQSVSLAVSGENYVTTGTKEFAEGIKTCTFDLDVELGSENKVEGKTLTLSEEGIYEITIPYVLYTTTDNGESFDEISPSSLTFKFMLFNSTTYLNYGMETPSITVSNDFATRNINKDAKQYVYYFYNYTSTDLPYISYDVTKFNLSVTRDYNLTTETEALVYQNTDPELFVEEHENSNLFDLTLNGHIATLYFSDLGDYTLDFDLIYVVQNGEDYNVYDLPTDVTNQKMYVFGYQSTYTVFNNETKTNSYPEFKEIKDHAVIESADITRYVSESQLQNLSNSLIFDLVVDSEKALTVKNAVLSSDENVTICFNVGTKEYLRTFAKTQLTKTQNGAALSEDATLNINETVYLVESEVIPTPVRTNQLPVKFKEYASIYGNGALYKATKNGNGYILSDKKDITSTKNVSDAGTYLAVFTYTFDEYLNESGLPASTEQFTQAFLFEIDNTTPSVEVYAGEDKENQLSSGAYTNKDVYIKNVYEESVFNSEVRIEIERFDFVNNIQRPTKLLNSYDLVDGYYKIEENGNYTIKIYYGRNLDNPIVRRFNIDKTDITEIQAMGVRKNGTGSTYTVTNNVEQLTNESLIFTWITKKASGANTSAYYRFYPITQTSNYTGSISNILSTATSDNLVPVDYKIDLNASASWIFYPNAKDVINSSAISSSYVKTSQGLYVLDIFDEAGNNTTMIYLLDKTTPNFVIKQIDQDGRSTYSLLNKSITISNDAVLYWGQNKVLSTTLPSSEEIFKTNKNNETSDNIGNAYDEFKTSYFASINYLISGQTSFIKIPVNEKVYFQDVDTSNYAPLNASSYDFVSSFKLLCKEISAGNYEYYFSTSINDHFIKIDNPETALVDNYSATLARRTGEVEEHFDLEEYNNQDGRDYQKIYNIEGTYVFLIRDMSNTKVADTELQTYLNYPSAYQMIQLTSDTSNTRIGYQDGEDFNVLKTADEAAYIHENESQKDIYYQPTSLDKQLYVNFVPKTETDGKIIQVESLKVTYYPFETKSSTYQKDGKTYVSFYKDLKTTPEYENLEVYSFNADESADEISIALQSVSNVTAPGKYVITRTYKTGAGFYVDEYDFTTRVFTLIVDKENVISEPELVEYESLSTRQSVIGNGIFVSVFADTDESVEYPRYDYGNPALNSGYTFYTKNYSFDDRFSTPVSVFTSNKLPFRIFVPEYKYTLQYQDTDNGFEISENESLSTFREGKVIDFYRLFAEIYLNNQKIAESYSSENGFLIFKDNDGQTITSFKDAGVYKVVVTQALNDTAFGDSFKNAYILSFTINESTPSFNLYNADGKALKSDKLGTYYTNSNKIITSWIDSTSEYNVNIDKKNILITLDNALQYKLVIENGAISSFEPITGTITYDDDLNMIFTYNKLDNENRLEIDLDKLNVNLSSIWLTLSYEHPDEVDNLYTSTTKKIQIDRTVFDENYDDSNDSTVERLFAKIGNIDNSLNIGTIRNYITYSGDTTTDKSKASFNTSVASGFYKYYSFVVDKTFFEGLISRVNQNKETNFKGMTSVYFRNNLSDIYSTSFVETDYRSFNETNNITYTLLNEDSINNLTAGKYYEIIESDYAGNLSIYIVYYQNANEEAITLNNANTEAISDEDIASNRFNIYGSSELEITSMKPYNDVWAFAELTNNNTTTRFVLSPYLAQEGKLRNLSTGQDVAFETILNNLSSTNKAMLTITNRVNGEKHSVYVNKTNASNINVEKYGNEGGIRILLPSTNVVTDNLIRSFPVKISIQIKEGRDNNYRAAMIYENNPNDNLSIQYSYQNHWEGLSDESVTFVYEQDGYLYVTLANISSNTKVKYTIVDNFGKETSLISLVGSNFTDGYEGKYYNSYDEDGTYYHRTDQSFSYIYNSNVYFIKVDGISEDQYAENNITLTNYDSTGSIKKLEFTCLNQTSKQYDVKYKIYVYDYEYPDADPVKVEYVHLYKVLPTLDGNLTRVEFRDENGVSLTYNDFGGQGSISINGTNYQYISTTTFARIINVNYTESTHQIPYQGYIYMDGEDDFVAIDSTYKINQSGVYYILFKYLSNDAFGYEYLLYRIEMLDSSTSFFYVTIDGNRVLPQKTFFTDTTGKQYSNYYIVNIPYSESSRVEIKTNEYQQVQILPNPIEVTHPLSNVKTIITTLTNKVGSSYPTGVSPYTDTVAISYIPVTTKPATKIDYVSNTGDQVSLIDTTSTMIVAGLESDYDTLKIRWNPYHGIEQNKINIYAIKDGKSYSLPTYSEDDYYYTLITISGSYRLSFMDLAGNVQKFGTKDYVDIIFLKDVHFTMISQDENGNEIETEAIDRGVFNGSVGLRLKNISSYYASSSIGNGSNMIHIKRNGVDYSLSKDNYNTNTSTFTFNEVGFYQVYFSATTINGIEVRQQTYSFTILNPNESRYAFEFAPFAGYTIEKTIKDNGISIEEQTEFTGNDLYTLYVNYDKNGNAKWTVTINTNKVLTPGSDELTKFTFSFLIRSNVPPIEVSVKEGTSTTKEIYISFNAENIYNSVGDCILTVGKVRYDINANTINEIGTTTITIKDAGTYFLQVYTESGNLLYSYKFVKNDPLNGWAIAAIVIGSVALVAGLVIVFRLRKRIRVK